MLFHKKKLKDGEKTYVYDRSKYTYECNRRYRREWNKSYYSSSGKYPRKQWTKEEEKKIMYSMLSDRELEEELERSIYSIQARRAAIRREGRDWLDLSLIVNKATPPRVVNT